MTDARDSARDVGLSEEQMTAAAAGTPVPRGLDPQPDAELDGDTTNDDTTPDHLEEEGAP